MLYVEFFRADDAEEAVQIGPVAWVQLTYEHLRAAPEGEHIAHYEDGEWVYQGKRYSDVGIGTESRKEEGVK